MNVFITVDTEIWCDGWNDLDAKFPESFRKYVYGPTAKGDFALPAKIAILREYGLKAVFFVEPLFTARFGIEPLQEMTGLLLEGEQEVQLHLHPEWIDVAGDALLPDVTEKCPNLRHCSAEQQDVLMAYGLEQLEAAGAQGINALRAGNFAANPDTLRAAAKSNLVFDSSYNAASNLGVGGISPDEPLTQPRYVDGVYEYPVTVFDDRSGRGMRHAQLTACSYQEFVHCLNAAYDAGWDSFVIVSHNFELMTPDKSRVDTIVTERFRRLCRFLDANRDRFNVCGFIGHEPKDIQPQPADLQSKSGYTMLRTGAQIARRLMYR